MLLLSLMVLIISIYYIIQNLKTSRKRYFISKINYKLTTIIVLALNYDDSIAHQIIKNRITRVDTF